MIRTLDRHLASLGFSRWAVLLFLGTFLVVLGDFIADLGTYLAALASSRWWVFLFYEAVRLPGFVLTWLPLSTLVAAMLTAAVMIGQGTLTALGAAGIAPARVFRPFLALALLTGITSLILADQVVPRLTPLIDRLELVLKAKGFTDLRNDRPRAAGWRSGDTVWSAARSQPVAGIFTEVAAFRSDQSRRMLNARSLKWVDGAWLLSDVVLVEGDALRSYPTATPVELGFTLKQEETELANALRADDSRTSDELFAAGAQRRWQILSLRVATALLPLLCLIYGFPRFVLWRDKSSLGVTGAKALLWGLVPLLATGLLARLLVSAGAQPVFLAAGVLGAVLTIGWMRWRRMRL